MSPSSVPRRACSARFSVARRLRGRADVMRRAFFTVDMEPDCPPLRAGWRGIDEGAPRLMELLARHDIPATLFVTGALVRRSPDLVRAWAERGHELGCHGDAHVRFSTLAPHAAHADLARATESLSRFGPVRSFRAPNLD